MGENDCKSSHIPSPEKTTEMAEHPNSLNFSLSMDAAENFRKVKETNWSKSHFITIGKFLKLLRCDKNFKLVFCCMLCPSHPGVKVSVDLFLSGNLRAHMIRKHKHRCSEFDS